MWGMTSTAPISTAEALAVITDALDRVQPDRSALSDGERLELVDRAGVVAGRVEGLRCALVAEADAVDASMRARGTPSSSWLALTGRMSKKESAGLLYRARDLASEPQVQQEVLAGTVGVAQARSISRVLQELPDGLSDEQRRSAAGLLLDHAQRVDAAGLAQMTGQVLREVAPEVAGEVEAQRLSQQAEIARRERSLWFSRDRGSIRFRGSLPVAEAEGWVAIIDAHVQSQRRSVIEARDPLAETPSPEQRRADALTAMIRAHQESRLAPSGGGDRPRIVVTLDYDGLRARGEAAGLVGSGQKLAAGDVRRLCCDADLVPVVLGSASEVLDVGRIHRLVTRGLRIALTHRDGGCAFPTCDTHPTACEAHHLVPWWDGGPTDLSNLALLCHHHHGLVEPDPDGQRDQWMVRIGVDGTPEFLPPRRVDPQQTPLRHQRFLLRDAARRSSPATSGPPGDPGVDVPTGVADGTGRERSVNSRSTVEVATRTDPAARTVRAQTPLAEPGPDGGVRDLGQPALLRPSRSAEAEADPWRRARGSGLAEVAGTREGPGKYEFPGPPWAPA